MGQDTGQIRQDIEETRGRMGETVEALGYKADVPGRAKQAVSDKVDTLKSKTGTPQENPLGLALGALAVGFVGGLLIPSTRVEDEKLGPMADQVKEKAKETGEEAMERGKEVARQAADTAKEAGREQAEGLRDSAGERAGEIQGPNGDEQTQATRPGQIPTV